MTKNIYELSTYIEIIDDIDRLNFKQKYQLINYLIIVGQKEKAFEVLKIVYNEKLSKKEKKRLDFLQLIYHINNNDNYNRDAIKYQLIRECEKDKSYYNLICEENLQKKIKIFEEMTKCNQIKRYFKNRNFRNNIIYTYIMNFGLLDKPINIKYIDKYINNSIKILNKKKRLNIYEIQYIEYISNFIFGGLSYIYIKNNDYFLNFYEYKELLMKAINERKRYKDYDKKRNIEFNTIMYEAIKGLINLDEFFSKQEKKEMNEYLIQFYNENVEELDESIRITRKVYKGDFWKEIEGILENKHENINLLDLIMSMVCFNYKDINKIYKKINEIVEKYQDKISNTMKSELLLGREIINLWANGVFDKDSIQENYKISDFTKLIIEFFSGNIKKEEFIFELNNVQKIDCFEILNWNLLEQKCNTLGNLEWLSMILDKIEYEFDSKAMEYFSKLYIDILQKKRVILLKDFLNISNRLIKKYDYNYYFLFNTTNILIQQYADFKDAESLIIQIIKNWDKIKISNKEDYFMSLLIVIVEQNMSKIEFKQIKQIIENIEMDINKNFIFLYLSLIYKNIKFSENEYKEILKFIIEVFKNLDNIENNLYRIIASMAMRYEQNKNILKLPKYDLIYYKNEKHYYKKTNDALLKESYSLLPLEETDNIDDSKEEHVLMFLICRIFFEKIEEKGIGKKIVLPSNSTAKEIIQEINKSLGIDEKINQRKKIREGEIIGSPWMNNYDYNSIFEDIISSKWKIFYNSKNNRFLGENKIIHISTAILLAKIGRLDVLEKNNCYVSNSIYEETTKRSKKDIEELGRGIIEEATFYDEDLDKLAVSLQKLKKEERIYTVTKAKLIPNGGINEFDDEMIKYIIDNTNDQKDFCVISEDPYWLDIKPFSNMSEGVISLLIDSFRKDLITSEELLDSIKKLDNSQYNMNIGNILYGYLLRKADDEHIKEIITIINNYKLNK